MGRTRCFGIAGILLALPVQLGGCFSTIENFSSLANQGIVPLSTTDPALGSNLFMAQEAEKSRYLFKFLQTKGAPGAIELIETPAQMPRLLMFYTKYKQVYAADLHSDKKTHEWVIRGPYGTERKDYRVLVGLPMSLQGEPVLLVHGREMRFGPAQQRTQAASQTLQPWIPPAPKPKPVAKAKTAPVKTGPSDPAALSDDPSKFTPLNTDQQAIRVAQDYAPRASNGDVLHTVHGDQRLDWVVKWYTGDSKHSAEVAKLNNVPDTIFVPEGMVLRIPLAHLKNLKQMPAGYKGE